jgi:hypothetical protein
VPSGGTALAAGDLLMIVAQDRPELQADLRGWLSGAPSQGEPVGT